MTSQLLSIMFTALFMFQCTSAFVVSHNNHNNIHTQHKSTTTSLSMGLFDGISKAFSNQEYGPPPEAVKAVASHILVPTEQEAQVVLKMLQSGETTFADAAREFSTCASSSSGGSLGSFGPGTMVAEFDKVVFSPDTEVGQIVGPILTDFGFHLIVVNKRKGGGDWY